MTGIDHDGHVADGGNLFDEPESNLLVAVKIDHDDVEVFLQQTGQVVERGRVGGEFTDVSGFGVGKRFGDDLAMCLVGADKSHRHGV